MHPGKCYCEVLIVRIQVTLVVHVKRPLRGTLFRVARRGFVWRERSETSSQTSANLPIWVVEVGRPWLPLLYVFPNHENLLVCLGGSRWVDFFRGNLSSSIWVKCGPGTGQWCLVCKGSWSFLLGLQRKLVWLLGEGCPTVVSLCWLWKVPFTSYPRKFAVVLHFISVPSLGLCQERPVFWTRSSSSIFLSCLDMISGMAPYDDIFVLNLSIFFKNYTTVGGSGLLVIITVAESTCDHHSCSLSSVPWVSL